MSAKWLRLIVISVSAVFVLAPPGPSVDTHSPVGVAQAQEQGATRKTTIAYGRFLRRNWELRVWKEPTGAGTAYCDAEGNGGHGCTIFKDEDWERFSRAGFITHGYSDTSNDTIEVRGTVGRRVRSVTLRLADGTSIPVAIVKVPERLHFPWNYYYGYIPRTTNGWRIARSAEGMLIDRERLFRHNE